MDKRACNFVNSETQTWPPSTIKSNRIFIKFLICITDTWICMLEYITLLALLKQSYGNKAERYGEKIVAEAKQESLSNHDSGS